VNNELILSREGLDALRSRFLSMIWCCEMCFQDEGARHKPLLVIKPLFLAAAQFGNGLDSGICSRDAGLTTFDASQDDFTVLPRPEDHNMTCRFGR
jgi:hypothetical protein